MHTALCKMNILEYTVSTLKSTIHLSWANADLYCLYEDDKDGYIT